MQNPFGIMEGIFCVLIKYVREQSRDLGLDYEIFNPNDDKFRRQDSFQIFRPLTNNLSGCSIGGNWECNFLMLKKQNFTNKFDIENFVLKFIPFELNSSRYSNACRKISRLNSAANDTLSPPVAGTFFREATNSAPSVTSCFIPLILFSFW